MSKLEERYRPRSRARRAVLVSVVAAVALAGLGWLGWTAWYRSHPDVVARVAAFDVASDTLTRATVTVDRASAGTPVRCFVYAQAPSFERVGEKWVTLPAGGARLVDLPVELRTFARATSVSVERCEVTR